MPEAGYLGGHPDGHVYRLIVRHFYERHRAHAHYVRSGEEVLEADGGPVVTRGERREAEAAAWAQQIARIAGAVPDRDGQRLLAAALPGDGPCGRWYRGAYREDAAVAEQAALAVARALERLPAGGVLLAVFAADVAGDPHACDRGRPEGALLHAALRELHGEPPGDRRDAEAWALLLARAGLDVDDVSSTVLAANLSASEHPVLAAMAERGGAWPLPLAAMRDLRIARDPGRPAFVVENPQVFAHLVRAARDPRPALVCTSGFVSAAAIRLLDVLNGAGYVLRYGGDFDRNGLAIAADLARRYAGLRLWRMAPADYAEAAGGVGAGRAALPPADAEWLARLDGPLAATARARSWPPARSLQALRRACPHPLRRCGRRPAAATNRR